MQTCLKIQDLTSLVFIKFKIEYKDLDGRPLINRNILATVNTNEFYGVARSSMFNEMTDENGRATFTVSLEFTKIFVVTVSFSIYFL